MDIVQSLILGVVEGVTEFLPISSTGHLIVVSDWLGLPQNDANTAYEVIIQVAAILAVFANYRDKFTPKHLQLWIKVLIGFLPIALVGLALHSQIKALFSIEVVAVMFIVGGVIFLAVERYIATRPASVEDVEQISYKQAAIIGFAQLFALIPGTSRAGATIVGALLCGISRKASAEFSFLLALPVLAAAGGLDLLKHYQEFAGSNLTVLLVGFVTAFLSAYLVMKLFITFLERFTFVAFGIYRILFGLLLFWYIAA